MDDGFVHLVAGFAERTRPDETTEREHCDFSGAAADVDDHATRRIVDLQASAERGSHGLEAVEAIGRERYDLVFMDCQMPEMDGFEATRAIRRAEGEDPANPLPIVALTANAFSGDEKRCRDAGMNEFLTKPLRPVQMVRALMKWLPEDRLGEQDVREAA